MDPRAGSDAFFRIEGLSHAFGGLRAVSGFDITMHEGEVRGLIGPNGAGKTTVFNLITGVYRPDAGRVVLQGEDIAGLASHVIVGKGIARTFQNIRLFRSMSVLDNIRTAGYCRLHYPLWSALTRTRQFKEDEERVRRSSVSVLEKFGLADRMNEPAAALPYGLQRRVELARALTSAPRLLLLDEPGAGMNPSELDQLADLVGWVRTEFRVSIILIEHRMRLVMRLCNRVTVLNFGETIFEGGPAELSGSEKVVKAYFGEDHADTLR